MLREQVLPDRFRCLVSGLESILDSGCPKTVKIVNFTIMDAHSVPSVQSFMCSTVEVRSAAGVQHEDAQRLG